MTAIPHHLLGEDAEMIAIRDHRHADALTKDRNLHRLREDEITAILDRPHRSEEEDSAIKSGKARSEICIVQYRISIIAIGRFD